VARRSPQNDRYKKDANIGSTRKSASSAKPKRKVADPMSSTRGSSSKSSSSKKKPATKGKLLLPNPDTEEFRRWNLINYGALFVAMAAAVAVLFFGKQTQRMWLYWAMWAIWGIGLASSMYIQLKIVRPMRVEWEKSGMAAAKSRELLEERAAEAAEREKTKADMAKAKADKKAAGAANGTGPAKASTGPKPDAVAKVTFKDEDD
jgi:hypothetical protein